MPFITPESRIKYQRTLESIGFIKTKGELEYCIFKLMVMYMQDKKICYSNLHDAVYAAIHCGDEFRRLYLDKREDEARETNGGIE